jgi:hypothetical protein
LAPAHCARGGHLAAQLNAVHCHVIISVSSGRMADEANTIEAAVILTTTKWEKDKQPE